MKQTLKAACCAAFVLSLSACSSSTNSQALQTDSQTTVAAAPTAPGIDAAVAELASLDADLQALDAAVAELAADAAAVTATTNGGSR